MDWYCFIANCVCVYHHAGLDILIHDFNEDIGLMASRVRVDKDISKVFILRKKRPLEISAENAEKRQKKKKEEGNEGQSVQHRYLEPKKNYDELKLKKEGEELNARQKEKEKETAKR